MHSGGNRKAGFPPRAWKADGGSAAAPTDGLRRLGFVSDARGFAKEPRRLFPAADGAALLYDVLESSDGNPKGVRRQALRRQHAPFAAAALGRRFPVEPRKQFRTPLLSIARLKAVDDLRCIVRKRCPSHLKRI